jgi:hypothetical protein
MSPPKEGRTVRDDIHVEHVSLPELWRLLGRFLAEIGSDLDQIDAGADLRRSYRRAQAVFHELRLRGTQTEIDLREN